jgi:hypothetical protein
MASALSPAVLTAGPDIQALDRIDRARILVASVQGTQSELRMPLLL